MKLLIMQEAGRHEKNKHFRECLVAQRALTKLGHECVVWGNLHENFTETPDFESFDVVINLENYDTDWVPDLTNVKNPVKLLWSIDAHCTGMGFKELFKKQKYNKILQATHSFVDKDSIWFPNCYDDEMIKPLNLEKKHFVGFCGNVNNREVWLKEIEKEFPLKRDIFVIGDDMVKVVNEYEIHFNKNISVDLNYRTFETIGCGTCLLTERSNELPTLGFVDMENCAMFSTPQELREKLRTLDRDRDLLKKCADGGLKLAPRHTFLARMRKLIEWLVRFSSVGRAGDC